MELTQILIITGCLILGLLGLIHLIYTLATNKFHARDPAVTAAMQQSAPIITGQTTVWRAWVGFNVSHSVGVLLLPLVYVPLALNHMTLLANSAWFAGLPVVLAAAYAMMAKQYWFKVPLWGSLLALLCFLAAWLLLTWH
ncbi:LIC_13387 family protein [Marinicella meishanensis]|uniref:LIC_13387 family protein n=1 Tax=Marinicella meishanensis TaxID=2873263 RepID=UPI001CBF82B6|nr:hypothetical protein [Marinicella sp. NBU2979]